LHWQVNQIASYICDVTTNESKSVDVIECKPEKNPAAVALDRLGGLKGGNARAESLSAKKRKTIAKEAAQTRWAKKFNN